MTVCTVVFASPRPCPQSSATARTVTGARSLT
jgi:hypothetical protein